MCVKGDGLQLGAGACLEGKRVGAYFKKKHHIIPLVRAQLFISNKN